MFVLAIALSIVLTTGLNFFYKLTTRTMKNASAQTVGLLIVAGLSCLIFMPFFELRFPSNPYTYLFLGLACIFYALNNRMIANVRKNLEASVVGILQQSYTVLMTLAGFLLLGEQATFAKIIGILMIIGGNILVFYQPKKSAETKYVWLGLLAYLCNVVAGLIDVGYSKEFNLSFYAALLYFMPALFILLGSRVRLASIADEFKRANKRNFFITGFCWGVRYLFVLVAYTFSEVSVVAPLTSLAVFTSVLVGYFWLGEKEHIVRKTTAAILAILGTVLISI